MSAAAKRDAEGGAGEDEIMQQYPSPTADGMETGPFFANPRESQAQGQQPPIPQQQAARHPNLEELQLAAQLGQGLAEEAEPPTDPSMTAVEHNLRAILPQPSEHGDHQTAGHQYVPDQPGQAQVQVPQHAPMPVGHQIPTAPQYAMEIPPRKRSKVSRACDECRRKKVKCDAQSDSGDVPCTNCKRAGLTCLFSRIPQKRGPSKGYIKELADRINSIEGKLDIQDDPTRKRPFSSISGDLSTPQPVRWGSDIRYPSSAPVDRLRKPYSAHEWTPKPHPIMPDTPLSRQLPDPTEDESPIQTTEIPTEVEDVIFQVYLARIHNALPFLPSTKEQLDSNLSGCPQALRDAFIAAIYAVVTSFSDDEEQFGEIRTAHAILHDWEGSPEFYKLRSPEGKVWALIYMETLLLFIIEADNRHRGDKGIFLGAAVAQANFLKFYLCGHGRNMESHEDNPDSIDRLELKVFWSLVILVHLDAAGNGVLSMITDEAAIEPPDLRNILGDTSFWLLRSAMLIADVAKIIPHSKVWDDPLSWKDKFSIGLLRKESERLFAYLPPEVVQFIGPLVAAANWHARILAYLMDPSMHALDLVAAAAKSTNLLCENTHLLSPFPHHFVSLTSLCLLELAKVPETHDQANLLLKELMESFPAVPPAWHEPLRNRIAQHLSGGETEEEARGSLQKLADLATATASVVAENADNGSGSGDQSLLRAANSNYEDLGFDPRNVLSKGYLNVAE